MLKSAVHYFPEADDPAIAPFARAFVRMMFAHAELEARIRALQDALTDDPTYGEKNSWSARDRPKRMRRLTQVHVQSPAVGRLAQALNFLCAVLNQVLNQGALVCLSCHR
jgi:hypothetical protein